MAIIRLNNGFPALVDDDMFEYLNQWNWTYSKGYAYRHGKVDGIYQTIYMHRFVNETPEGMHTDHISGDKSDNRKSNLRTVTKSQNNCNKKAQSNSTSGYKGVSWHKSNKSWQAYIKINGKNIALGSYKNKEAAAQAYNEAALKYHGEFARLNIVEAA